MNQKWSLRGKIVVPGILLPSLLITILFWQYAGDSREKTVLAFVDKARAICLTAESVRQEMEHKWELGLFSNTQLRAYAEQGEDKKLLAAVPVVSAWEAAMRRAEEGGYTFKTPKFSPRNPKNEPDALEAKALKLLEEKNLQEYYEIDPDLNAVRYFRPVGLTQTCLVCHGDPAQSVALWGNSQGLDPTGGRMENWQAGEVHGAFEIIQSLSAADRQLTESLKKAGLLVGLGLIGTGIIFTLSMLYLISGSVIRPIGRIIDDIATGAANLLETSGLVSQSSQRLADGATDQASSLEETSASLEEMSAMTKSNAENVSQTSMMAENVQQAAETAQKSMERMTEAIALIKDSSDRTASIIKTIDEIAFQTNLLALNAAVEAARAGEAGAGFAVVADEVRTLAQRSATASRETAQLIEEARGNSNNGVAAAEEVKKILIEIVTGVKKVSQLSQEITVASDEQALGVGQINLAVSQVDKVTQSNAAVSEETASASEQLTGQARELNEAIARLAGIVGLQLPRRPERAKLERPSGYDRQGERLAAPAKKPSPAQEFRRPPERKPAPAPTASRSRKADEVIPLDDGDFEDF